jgi:hypothetical protein
MPTPPCSLSVATTDIQTGPKLRKDGQKKFFGEYVGVLRRRGHMKNLDMTQGNTITDEMEMNLDVLGTLMLNQVAGHVDSTGGRADQQAKTLSALNILKNPLESNQVGFTQVMHVQADLLNSISDVGFRKCQILQGANNTQKTRSNLHRWTISR